MRDRQEVHKEGLSREDLIHGRLKFGQNGVEHLIDISGMEKPLCGFCNVEVHRSEINRVSSQLARVREELLVQCLVEWLPGYSEIIYVQ